MLNSLYGKNRLLQFVVVYFLVCSVSYTPNEIWALIASSLAAIVFIVQSFDIMASLVFLIRPTSKFFNTIIGLHLWQMKYEADDSFVEGIRKYWLFDYVLWLPLAIISQGFGFSVLTIIILISLVLSAIFAFYVDTIKQNNVIYFEN